MNLNKTLINIKKSKSIFFNLKGKVWINKDLVRLGLLCKSDFPMEKNITIRTKKLRYFGIDKYLSISNYYIFTNIIENVSNYKQLYYETK